MPNAKDLIVSLLVRATQSVMNVFAQDAAPLLALNRVLVVAPHPDDETLGCGGFIAQACEQSRDIRIVIVSDGAQGAKASDMNIPDLAATRRREAIDATSRLGVAANAIAFLNLPDGHLPGLANELDQMLAEQIAAFAPDLLLSPYLEEKHPDHRAIAESLHRLRKRNAFACDWAEYPVWFWPSGAWKYLCSPKKRKIRKVNIKSVLGKKKSALNAYRSQLPVSKEGESATGYFKPMTFSANFLGNNEYYISPNASKKRALTS